ncbi:OmpA family protein [Galbibacter mesophilus]|uniref:OmpA family protein n=1 Tax=Galbibacter mesophilus TaxID=379069 RepID=UPI00191E7E72|nr:OmpA family protein [Galbibacter mesophilus]MCM5661964.1 OmpA family protein [Galbibacter mesophilus]
MKIRILILAMLSVSFGLYAQKNTWKADELFTEYHFEEAAKEYEKNIEKAKKMNPATVERVADSYFNINDYKNAYAWYEKLYDLEKKDIKESTFIKYIQSAKSCRHYEKANELIKEFYADDYERLSAITTQKRHLDELKASDSLYKIRNVSVNTPMSDFAPMYYKDYLIFSSARDTSVSKDKIYPWNKQPYLDFYISERNKSNGELKPAKKFELSEKTNFHDATIVFSKDDKFVYFTSNYTTKNKLKTNRDGVSNLELLKGYVNGETITNIEPLEFNRMRYSCGHPAISADGKYLYFASDMPGGYGESDLYVAEIYEDGTTGEPVNLGPKINTPGREMFPFATDSILYFSSDAHYGLGGMDVFQSKIISKTSYETPLNMGPTLNGNMDDFSFIYNPKDRTGYFASNRSMGKGDDDIYYFKKRDPLMHQLFSGYVYDSKTKEPLPEANIEVRDILLDSVTQTFQTDEDGYYEVKLPFKNERELHFSKTNYTSKTLIAQTTENHSEALTGNDVYLTSLESLTVKEGDKVKIDVDPIYFELDKAEITPQAQVALKKVLYVMKEFPTLNIMIESHTDSRGSDTYNMKLSNARAENTKRYLIASGIDSGRIEGARGFGESRLLNHCSNGVNCAEEEHSLNRRSNFIIVEE